MRQEYQEAEDGTIGGIQPVAVGEEAEASRCLTGDPLIAWEALTGEMGGSVCFWGLLITYVFDIGLQEGERLLRVPRPDGGIEAFAWLALLRGSASSQDMPDDVWGERESPWARK